MILIAHSDSLNGRESKIFLTSCLCVYFYCCVLFLLLNMFPPINSLRLSVVLLLPLTSRRKSCLDLSLGPAFPPAPAAAARKLVVIHHQPRRSAAACDPAPEPGSPPMRLRRHAVPLCRHSRQSSWRDLGSTRP